MSTENHFLNGLENIKIQRRYRSVSYTLLCMLTRRTAGHFSQRLTRTTQTLSLIT